MNYKLFYRLDGYSGNNEIVAGYSGNNKWLFGQ